MKGKKKKNDKDENGRNGKEGGRKAKGNMKHTSKNMKRLGTKANVASSCHLKGDAKEETWIRVLCRCHVIRRKW